MYKKKFITSSVVAALILSVALTGCGNNSNSATFSNVTISGTVESVEKDTITVSVSSELGGESGFMGGGDFAGGMGGGNLGDMPGGNSSGAGDQSVPEKPEGDQSTTGTDASEASSGETGENPSGDAGEMPSGEGDGNVPEKPEGDGNATGTDAGEAPSGDAGEMPSGEGDGNVPEKPEGDGNTTGTDAGEMPSGDAGEMPSGEGDGNVPEKLEGDGNTTGTDAGEAPSTDAGETTEKNGEENSSDTQESETESADNTTEDATEETTDDSKQATVELVIKDESVLENSDGEDIELESIQEGDSISVTFDNEGNIESVVVTENSSSQDKAGTGSSSNDITYTALNEFSEDTEVSDETYDSTGTDENTIHVLNGAEVVLKNIIANRNSQDSTGGDNSSFYGVGADVLVSDGKAYINGGTFTTDADGGAGIFAYNSGVAYVSNATISTSGNTSGGIHAAGGGTLYAWNLDVTTQGESSAAIRSDRGGGTMVVDGGTYTSNGTGSPAVYCTADIAVNNATLTANNSEGVCIEGLNMLKLYDCNLTGTMHDDSQNDCTWNIIVYQSMSGDSEVGNGTFNMTGGSITANNGGIFYTTNTECTMYISDVDITYADDNPFFLQVTGNTNQRGWGQSGQNGSQCNFTADNQTMEGNVIYDSISTLDFYMINGSSLKGAILDDETWAGNGGDGYCNIYIDKDSTWTVTGDSTVTALSCEGTIVDESGKTVTIVGTDGTTYVQGDSQYTITVSSYSDSVDVSGATDGGDFSDYAVTKPSKLD